MTTPQQERLHIAIIPDGNRRWAKKRLLNAWKGHEKSAENFRSLIEWARKEPSIGTLTIWCFSTENWKRDSAEVEKLMSMLQNYITTEEGSFQKNGIRVVHSGRTDRFSSELQSALQHIQNVTKANNVFTLNLAVDYGGQDEILRAMNKLQHSTDEKKMITNELLRSYLDQPTLPDIDLIIRTSGEKRTSNFFLWQSTYAEWIFSEKLFPDFTTKDLEDAVMDFRKRSRRFGG